MMFGLTPDPFGSQAQTVDLVLLSHGDTAHVGLFPYAHARHGLRAPAYASLPVQAMGRIAVLDNIESIRLEEAVEESAAVSDSAIAAGLDNALPNFGLAPDQSKKRKIATVKEVNDAFDSLHILRYSQPAHLQGEYLGINITQSKALLGQENARVSRLPHSRRDIPLEEPYGKFALRLPGRLFTL